jgi:hypothetical protein
VGAVSEDAQIDSPGFRSATAMSRLLRAAAASLQPRQQAGTHIASQFELDGAACLLLNDHRPFPYLRSRYQVSRLDLDQITATKLAVDGKVKESTVSQPSFSIQEEAGCPYLLLRQRAFRSDHLSRIRAARPRTAASW